MKTKKTSNADLENKRSLFFQIGIVLALGVVLLAFEWDRKVSSARLLTGNQIEVDVDELPPITFRQEKNYEPPKPIVVQTFELVPDDANIDEQWEPDVSDIIDEPIPVAPVEKDETEDNNTYVIGSIEFEPEFPGGMQGLLRYISQQVKYPVTAMETGIEGKVYVTFIINKEGKVIKASIARGVHPSLDREALRVINSLPQWKPGYQNGKPVKVSFVAPINFVLQ